MLSKRLSLRIGVFSIDVRDGKSSRFFPKSMS